MTAPPPASPNVRQAVPFFWVHDLQRSLRFYVEGLGFDVTRQWDDEGLLRWCWLEHGEAALMLQEFWKDGPRRNVPDGPLGVGVSIAFVCADAIALWRACTARGVAATRPVVGNGMWVTNVFDPDGYALSFESPTDVAEESIYPEGADAR
jgi:catechol 2,3-dioxygenase-like lactoylglutathione lyase family enzyme